MSAAITQDLSLLNRYSAEWAALRARPHNVLLEGPGIATSAVLLLLQPHIRGPIVWNTPDVTLDLPHGTTGALILQNVGALTEHDQVRLLNWLGGKGSDVQVVSTSDQPLFPRVAQGLFDESLYYRLNVMRLQVGTLDEVRKAG